MDDAYTGFYRSSRPPSRCGRVTSCSSAPPKRCTPSGWPFAWLHLLVFERMFLARGGSAAQVRRRPRAQPMRDSESQCAVSAPARTRAVRIAERLGEATGWRQSRRHVTTAYLNMRCLESW